MKPSIFKSFLAASLIILATGCGKSGGGGGGSGSGASTIYNNSNPYLSASSKGLMTELSNWYAAAEPATLRNFGIVTNDLSTTGSNTSSCAGEIKHWLGLDWCITTYGSGSSTTNANEVRYLVGVNPSTGYVNPQYCVRDANNGYCSTASATVVYPGKTQNTKLNEALTGRGNTLFLLNVQKLSTTVYQLMYAANSIEQQASVIYLIDTSVHSMYNPVSVVDLRATVPSQQYIRFY